MKNPLESHLILFGFLTLVTAMLLMFSVTSLAEEPGSITGSVYCDHDKDGNCGCEEQGIKDIPVQIFMEHCGGTALQTVHTDKRGNFSFKNFEPGDYFVRVRLDYVCGGRVPTTTDCRQVELPSGETVNLPAFGYSEYGQ